jgi:hypothetical protein
MRQKVSNWLAIAIGIVIILLAVVFALMQSM